MFPRLALLTVFCVSTSIAFLSDASGQTFDSSALRADIHDRLRSGHVDIPYSQTDEAMARIHADETTTGSLVLFYTRRSQDIDDWVNGNPQDGWNREHLWPQSRGTRGRPMKSDLFHLMPTDASVNQNRGNLNFDEGGDPEGEAADTFLDGDSFEPADEVKGDVARALFYMDVRYEGTNGEPDLKLLDEMTTSGDVTIGSLCTLLAWHTVDPVDDAERKRNDDTEVEQGNRNAFIDEPELAELLYGAECGAPAVLTLADRTAFSTLEDTLRIGTWNIANLHHETGVGLRGSALPRDDEDYARLAEVVVSMDLDIAALQEIGSPTALARVFPPEDYHLVLSDRYVAGAENAPAEDRDIYTAMAFAKDRFPELPPVSTFEALGIGHVGFDRDGTPSIRPTRAGMITEIQLGGESVKILNVHLKSSCHRFALFPIQDQNASGEPYRSRFDCRTLGAQLNILESWLEQQAAQGTATIVLGDFNRDMNAETEEGEPLDAFWRALNDGTPNALEFEKGPLGIDEVCWPDHGDRFEDHIDFVVWDTRVSDLASVSAPVKLTMGHENDPKYATIPDPENPGRTIRQRQKLSDHCPVVIEIGN